MLASRFEHESQISPTSGPLRTATSSSTTSNVSPSDRRMSGLGNYRRELAVLETSGVRVPQIQHNPPTAASPNPIAPWMLSNGSSPVVPSSAFPTSFYDDSSDNLSQGSQLSPGFRPGTGRTGNTSADSPDHGYFHDTDERRPSIASVTTASSSGSKSSVVRPNVHKSLKSFFGDDFIGKDASDTSLSGYANGKEYRSNSWSRHRNPSTSTETGPPKDASPASPCCRVRWARWILRVSALQGSFSSGWAPSLVLR